MSVRRWNPLIAQAASLVVLATTMPCASRPALAEPGRWGLGGGAALVEGYASGWSDGFEGTSFPYLSIEHRMRAMLWLRGEAGYQGFRSGSGTPAREADWVPVGLGVRLQGVAPVGIGAYLEFYPTLFFVHWLDHTYYDGDGGTVREWQGVVPGLMSGIGLQLKASESIFVSYGFRFHRSARPPADLHPLSQNGFAVSLDWRPAHKGSERW